MLKQHAMRPARTGRNDISLFESDPVSVKFLFAPFQQQFQFQEHNHVNAQNWRRSVVKYGGRVSQVKRSNCFRSLKKVVLPSNFDTSLSSLMT